MQLEDYFLRFQPEIETTLKQAINGVELSENPGLKWMLGYSLGWEGDGSGLSAQGKRIRPFLVLLCCEAAGSNWMNAIPFATAVELIHNFSLIHDDIQDNSAMRRGRPSLWKQVGVPQAINAGDAMFSIARLTPLKTNSNLSQTLVLAGIKLLDETCLRLTAGQYQDIDFEQRSSVSSAEYIQMITGKTAALLAAACQLGALAAGGKADLQSQLNRFGHLIGLAFQIQDDYLGIWGDEALTGKSTESDLVSGKKTYPVLLGIERSAAFRSQIQAGGILHADVEKWVRILEGAGIREETLEMVRRYSAEANQILYSAVTESDARAALLSLIQALLTRKG